MPTSFSHVTNYLAFVHYLLHILIGWRFRQGSRDHNPHILRKVNKCRTSRSAASSIRAPCLPAVESHANSVTGWLNPSKLQVFDQGFIYLFSLIVNCFFEAWLWSKASLRILHHICGEKWLRDCIIEKVIYQIKSLHSDLEYVYITLEVWPISPAINYEIWSLNKKHRFMLNAQLSDANNRHFKTVTLFSVRETYECYTCIEGASFIHWSWTLCNTTCNVHVIENTKIMAVAESWNSPVQE